MTTNTIGHETGAYGGDRDQEILERLRRMETRGNAFYRHMGHNPKRKDRVRDAAVVVDRGRVEVTGADITLGEISNAANAARLTGSVPVYVNGNYWGYIDV